VSDAPAAADDSASGDEDGVLSGNVLNNDTDVEGDGLNALLINGPSHGSLVLNKDGSFTYRPETNWSGTDSFTYLATDGDLDSNVATVALKVRPVNDAPVLYGIDDFTVAEGIELRLTAAAFDVDGDALTYSLTGPDGALIDPNTGVFTWTPSETQGYGVYTIAVGVSDGDLIDSQSFSVTVMEDTNIDAGMWAGNGIADTFRLFREGETTKVEINGTLVFSSQSAVPSLNFTGSSDNDSLVVDFTGGSPIPVGGIFFNGGDGSDDLRVVNGSAGTVIHTFTGSDSGSVDVDGETVAYAGLEPIVDTLIADSRVFSFGSGSDQITLSDDGVAGNGRSRIDSPLSERVDFRNPTKLLTILGNDGADTVTLRGLDSVGGGAMVVVDGGAGNDRLDGSRVAFDAVLLGGAGNDVLSGGSGNDLLSGGDGDDILTGGLGNDTLLGGAGLDKMDGGLGNDLLVGGIGNDYLVGGDGNDTLEGGAGNDYLVGGNGDDAITGGVGTDVMSGGAGVNTLTQDGAGLFDYISTFQKSGSRWSGLSARPAGSQALMAEGGPFGFLAYESPDHSRGISFLVGEGTLVETGVFGNDGALDTYRLWVDCGWAEVSLNGNLIYSRPVADVPSLTFTGSSDADRLIVDFTGGSPIPVGGISFNGGLGNDDLQIVNGTVNTVLYTFTGPDSGSVDVDGKPITYAGLEPIVDTLVAASRVFSFSAADDQITLSDDGVSGNGISRIDSPTSEQVDFRNPTKLLTILGNDGVDTVTLRGLDSVGGGAMVVVDGGTGNDRLDASKATFDVALLGDAGNDVLTGGSGNDLLSGGIGDDVLGGGLGNDTLLGGDGLDKLDGGWGNDALAGGNGNDYLLGGDGNDTLEGGDGNDMLVGGNGDDTLLGGAGTDMMIGGLGANTLVQEGVGDIETISTFQRGGANGWSRFTGQQPANSWLLDYLFQDESPSPNQGIIIKV
jgi:VCBS repeat-containing protein